MGDTACFQEASNKHSLWAIFLRRGAPVPAPVGDEVILGSALREGRDRLPDTLPGV